MGLRHTALVCLLALPPLALAIPTSVGPTCPLAWGKAQRPCHINGSIIYQ